MKLFSGFIFLFIFFSNTVFSADSQQSELLKIFHAMQNNQVDLLEGELLHIQSDVGDIRLHADIYAINHYDFSELITKLSTPSNWCQFITLHLNIKACVYQMGSEKSLVFYAGRKFYEPAESAYELRYKFSVKKRQKDYFKLVLSAKSGPFSTSNYLIELELLQIGENVLMHFSLSYDSSFSSRLGSNVYLSTMGADKIGFSQVENNEGKKEFIKGVEGIIERNAMRYFLALNVYFEYGAVTEKLLPAWFDATEQYHDQLHEVEKSDYLRDKKQEFNQQLEMQKRLDTGQGLFEENTSD